MLTCVRNVSGVYKITNTANGKVYVGSSVDLCERHYRHGLHLRQGRHHSIHLQRAYVIYGQDAFVFSVIEKCGRDALLSREQYWIDKLKAATKEYGYNVAPRTDNSIQAAETKDKIRKSLTGHPVSTETRLLISRAKKGKAMPESMKENLRRYWKDGKVPSDVLEKMRKGRTGMKNKPEHNELLRRINTGSKRSEETKRKLREAWIRRKAMRA